MTEPRETQQGVTIKREDSPDWTDPTLDAEWKTPPDLDFAGEGSNAVKSPTWTDPAQDEPWTTPHDLTLEGEDEDGGVSRPPTDYLPKNMLKIYTPADEAFMTIFHGVTMASLHREWQIPPKGEDAEEDEVVGDSAGENVAQAEDDLAQKVLRALQSEDEMEEIAVEMYEGGDSTAAEAGSRRGGDIQARQRRTLQVGRMQVRLPVSASSSQGGSTALPRGSLMAKVLRLARQAAPTSSSGGVPDRTYPSGATPPKAASKPPLKRRRQR